MGAYDSTEALIDQIRQAQQSGNGGNGYYPTGNINETLNRYVQGETDQRAELKRQFDVKYEMDKQNADRNYKVAMMGARTQQDVARANAEYQRAQIDIAKERLAFDRETQAQEFGLKQANLGYNVLNMASQLRGPQNYFQAANFARGVNAQPGTSTFLDALKNNSRLADYGAQYGVPDKVSLGNILDGSGLQGAGGGGSGTGTASSGGTDDYRLNQIRGLYARGAHQLGAGSLENLTDTERKLLISGIDEVGGDSSTFLDQYRRSRIGQSYGAAQAA